MQTTTYGNLAHRMPCGISLNVKFCITVTVDYQRMFMYFCGVVVYSDVRSTFTSQAPLQVCKQTELVS